MRVSWDSWEMRELFFPGPDRTSFVGCTTQEAGRDGPRDVIWAPECK